MNCENINYDKDETTAIITINKPPANSLCSKTLTELNSAIDDFGTDNNLRVAIITGAGKSIFAAGADINEIKNLSSEDARRFSKQGQMLFNRIETLPKIVIAAINGACLGGGNELAMACDILIAAKSARFGQPEINLGLIPGWGGTQRLPRLVGKTRALELLLTGDKIMASEAMSIGLVHRVVPDDEIVSTARKMAQLFAQKAPIAIQYVKEAVSRGMALSLEDALSLEGELFEKIANTKDAREGLDAFLSKRMPSFKGK